MKKTLTILFSIATLSITLLLSGCYYDKEEALYPDLPDGCDTINISYSNHIAPIMVNNCNACHGGNFPDAGVRTDNYTDLKQLANNGPLWGVVNHESGYSPMPKDKPKLSDCYLKQINIWVENGSPE